MIDLQAMENELPQEFTADSAIPFLPGYKDPLKVLSQLVKAGDLIRLRRGLYAFSKNFDRLSAAGSVYAPSYISFETALAFYGLIPEKVELVMSVTDRRSAIFKTPAGIYQYYSQAMPLFSEGMSMVKNSNNRMILIANKEKSLFDTLNNYNLKASGLDCREVFNFVISSLRIEKENLLGLSIQKIRRLAPLYRNSAPVKFLEALEKFRSGEKF